MFMSPRTRRGRGLAAVLASTMLASCATPERQLEPGTTAGQIFVGSPRVSGRERLVNERRAQDEWLDRQMALVDHADFGISGGIDTRSFAGLTAGLQARVGPDVDLFRLQQINNLALAREQAQTQATAEKIRAAAVEQIFTGLSNKTIEPKDAQAQLSALGFSFGALSTGVASAPAPSASSAVANLASAMAPTATAPAKRVAGSGASGDLARVSATPVNRFEDLLALRNRIDAEKAQNGLDETHDMYGNTLYRLTFDATVLPDNDTSAWGVIEIEVRQTGGANERAARKDYRSYKERSLNARLNELVDRLAKHSADCKGDRPHEQIPCAADKAFSRDLAQQVRGFYQARIKDANEEAAAIARKAEAVAKASATASAPRTASAQVGGSQKDVRQAATPSAPAGSVAAATRIVGASTPTKDILRLSDVIGLQRAMQALTNKSIPVSKQQDTSPAPAPAPAPPPAPAPAQAPAAETAPAPAAATPEQAASKPSPSRLITAENEPAIAYTVIAGVISSQFDRDGLSCFFALKAAGDEDFPSPDDRQNVELRIVERADGEKKDGACRQADPTRTFVDEIRKAGHMRVYAVTPKETVQQISDVSSRRTATELLLGLSALPGAGAIDAVIRSARENEAFLQALRRQPLVVGFASVGAAGTRDGSRTDGPPAVKFGWILGPTYSVVRNGTREASGFRHVVRQQALTADVSVPSWWRSMELKVTTRWDRENHTLRNEWAADEAPKPVVYTVNLPLRMASIDGVLTRNDIERKPVVDQRYAARVQVGQPARLLIEGRDLWRSSEVFLGAQRADRVRLLPNMQGLVAEFDQIGPMWGANSADVVPIIVATSEGTANVGEATIVRNTTAPPSVVGFGRRFIGDQLPALALDPPLRSFRLVELRAMSRDMASMNVSLADTGSVGGLVISRDGTVARVTAAKTDSVKIDAGQSIDLFLLVGSDASIAPESVTIQKNAVYYPTADKAKAEVAWAGPGPGLREVLLTPPNGVRDAYDSASTGSLRLLATLKPVEGDPVDLDPVTCTLAPENAKTKPHVFKPCKLKLDNPRMTAGARVHAKAGTFELTLKLDGDDAPALKSSTLKGNQ